MTKHGAKKSAAPSAAEPPPPRTTILPPARVATFATLARPTPYERMQIIIPLAPTRLAPRAPAMRPLHCVSGQIFPLVLEPAWVLSHNKENSPRPHSMLSQAPDFSPTSVEAMEGDAHFDGLQAPTSTDISASHMRWDADIYNANMCALDIMDLRTAAGPASETVDDALEVRI
ncbi:hypothetical protein T492DRAFT_1042051 [Pavlovales sp. CCMP2436]|nr:hypothetical protein T492DRAFT_1042051 [Pavlovales sp. CCMP2436]|mmetsp:Transcript_47827/g.111660  ORF Transcript_47827/g.111660 Transcript_47827/m.111660 type:complete len:173 (+) Transcript_47827:27-545(+)